MRVRIVIMNEETKVSDKFEELFNLIREGEVSDPSILLTVEPFESCTPYSVAVQQGNIYLGE